MFFCLVLQRPGRMVACVQQVPFVSCFIFRSILHFMSIFSSLRLCAVSLLVLLGLGMPVCGWGQTPTDSTQAPPFFEQPALSPVTIIAVRPSGATEERFSLSPQDRLAHDGAALLSRTPSLSLIRKAGQYGFDPVLRGFKYDQLNVVIDGVQSANAACPNRMDPATSQVVPNMIRQVEIFKGPHSLRYGPALGGTINFSSVQPSFALQTESYGRLSGSYEANGNLLRSETQVGVRGKAYDLSLFGAWSQGNDYRAGNDETVQADFLRASFGAQLGLKLSAAQQLTLSANRNLARDADFPALPMDLRRDDTWLFKARHRIELDRGALQSWQSSAYFTRVDHLMDNLLKPLDPRRLNAQTEALTLTYGGRSETHWQWQQQTLYLGVDARVEEAEGIRSRAFLLGPLAGRTLTDDAWQQSRIAQGGIFGEYQWQGTHWYSIASARWQLNRAQALDPAAEFLAVHGETAITQVNPSLSLGGGYRWTQGWDLSLWLGRAQRSAGLTERYINFFPVGLDPYELVGDPQLAPEVNHQADLSLRYRREKTTLEITAFGAYLTDFISSVIDSSLRPRLPSSPGVRRFVNLDRALLAGLELQWQQQLGAGLSHELALAYTYGQDLTREAPLPEIAPLDLRYTLRGDYGQGRWQPTLTLRHVRPQTRIAEAFGEATTPGFTLLDAQLRYRPLTWLLLSTGVQNALDVAYYEHLNRSVRGADAPPIFAPGRNLFASVTLTW
jgi:iron complex outermembrane recepter protein